MQKFTCHFLLILLTYFFCHKQLQIVADIVSIWTLWASFLLRFFSAISLIPFHHKEYKLVLWSKCRFEMMGYVYPVSNNGLSASQLSCICTNHDTKEQTVHVSYELVCSCHLLLLYKHRSFAPGTFWNKLGHFFYLRDIAVLLMFVHCHSVVYVLLCK
jgi:hypothetical protein